MVEQLAGQVMQIEATLEVHVDAAGKKSNSVGWDHASCNITLLSWSETTVDRQPVQVTNKIDHVSAIVMHIPDSDIEHKAN